MLRYKGDLLPKQAWDILGTNPKAYLIDVRTKAEWHYVGKPNLSSIKKELITIEWRSLPNMELNENFANELTNKILDHNSSLLFLCRTGGRSIEAASHMTALGYLQCYNITFGFEGDINERGRRGLVNGWKADQLAWRQD